MLHRMIRKIVRPRITGIEEAKGLRRQTRHLAASELSEAQEKADHYCRDRDHTSVNNSVLNLGTSFG